MSQITREQYLELAIEAMREGIFKGYVIPKVRVSVGFPGGGSARKRIGENWSPKASSDGIGQIFISPILDNVADILAVLVHELVHSVVGNEAKHGPVFRKCAIAVGLEGKMTSTVASTQLKERLNNLIATLGKYPHGKLNLNMRSTKKQSTRMIKMECSECGYIARTSQSNIDKHGPTLCPCNGEAMQCS